MTNEIIYHSYKSASKRDALNNTALDKGKYRHNPEDDAHESAGNGSKEAKEEYGSFSINASGIAEAVYEKSSAKIEEIANAVYSASISKQVP